jgi:hypothetical protein
MKSWVRRTVPSVGSGGAQIACYICCCKLNTPSLKQLKEDIKKFMEK